MELAENLFGLHAERLETHQMIVRAIIIFFIALTFIRISGVRTLGKQTAFDHLTALMLGAIMGRAIVAADQPFFGSIIATLVIMLLHRFIAWITFKSKRSGWIFKGKQIILMKDGKMVSENMKKTNITKEDILEALRRDINQNSFDKIKEAYLERSGEISFIKD